ncbi:CoB--CoM heterodisulfide reductase subunit C [Methanobrevibacter sp.]|uniref:CoB--CoM heterodisulfide reductase subunit C n=1 Tax=Methanobrevibacter sp. TaxID=66852 RepID=UPI00388E9417
MSVLDTLKSLIGGAKKDIDKNLTKEAESVEEAADSIQTSSEEEIEVKSDSETISEEEPLEAEAPAEEEVIVPVEEEEEAPEEEAPEEVEAEEAPVEEEAVEEAVEEVPEEEVSLDEEEESIDDKLSEDEESLEAAEEAAEEEASEENEESDNMTLLKENDIYSMDDIDKEFTQKFVDAGIETVDHCFQCGTCGGGCPSGRRTPYRVRQIVRKCLLGLREEVVSDPALWMCTTCYTCQERCPRSVKIVDIIKMARNEAAKAGYMADAHKATGSFVIKFGHGVPINDKTKELRKAIGLDELPPTVHSFPEALEEVQKICAACEFDKLIGFNMETGELE